MKEEIRILLSALLNGPEGILAELGRTSIEIISDVKEIDIVIKNFLNNIRNPEIENQMEILLEDLKKQIRIDIKEYNPWILNELSKILDSEMALVDIPKEQRENLKRNLFTYILTYIKYKDVRFFNILVSNNQLGEDINRVIQRVFELEKQYVNIQNRINSGDDAEKFPLRIPVKSLGLSNPEKLNSRKGEKATIQHGFDEGSNVIFLYGRPGIGKTTLARMYANTSGYQEIYFEEYDKSIENTIAKLWKKDSQICTTEKMKMVLDYWESLSAEKRSSILLIIDNFNGDSLQSGRDQHYVREIKSEVFKRLKDIGIHILVTTRIHLSLESGMEVKAVNDTMKLFEEHYKGKLTEEQKVIVKELIDIVQENTMLIIQLAHIFYKSDDKRRQLLIEQLKNCRLKENDILLEDATLYEQAKAMLNFEGIATDPEIQKAFACAVLLPLSGENKNKFIEMSQCNINSINQLIDGSWILLDSNENISVHPVVREVAFREGFVTYGNCESLCVSIKNALDLKNKLSERYPYSDCAWEIYKFFSITGEWNSTLIELIYRLSDIYDQIGDHSRSMELASLIYKNIDSIDLDIVIKARMLSGIAYSINNSYKSISDLDTADELLKKADKIIKAVGEDRWNALDVIQTRTRILSNKGSNCLARRKYCSEEIKKYLQDALSAHGKALELRKKYLEEIEDEEYQEKAEYKKINQTLKLETATSFTTVATDYFYLKDYKRAIQNHLKALDIRNNLEDRVSICVNQQRIIGCVLESYRNSFSINEEWWDKILGYYPDLLLTNYEYHNVDEIKTNLSYFIDISTIIQNDRRMDKYINEMKSKKNKIMDWLSKIEELKNVIDIEMLR